jgi:HK97 family phage prohead protease
MPIVPHDHESQPAFLERCIPFLIDEGTAKDPRQAAAICYRIYAQSRRNARAASFHERRAAQLEVRARGRKLEGYAATFGIEARIGEDFTEVIAPGAFARSLDGDIVALLDHDTAKLLARTRSKTLRLSEDDKGLAFSLDLPKTTAGNDVLALAERNDLGGMSFGFVATEDSWDGNRRTLRGVDLREISVVSTWPAYEGTVVDLRDEFIEKKLRLGLFRKYLETV